MQTPCTAEHLIGRSIRSRQERIVFSLARSGAGGFLNVPTEQAPLIAIPDQQQALPLFHGPFPDWLTATLDIQLLQESAALCLSCSRSTSSRSLLGVFAQVTIWLHPPHMRRTCAGHQAGRA